MKSFAPWTPEQVERLRTRQKEDVFHPYTCIKHSHRSLVPTINGWICDAPGCDYSQNWAHDLDANHTRWWDDVSSFWNKLEDA
jgi:hypothetical protein